jgi:hypothetical protein
MPVYPESQIHIPSLGFEMIAVDSSLADITGNAVFTVLPFFLPIAIHPAARADLTAAMNHQLPLTNGSHRRFWLSGENLSVSDGTSAEKQVSRHGGVIVLKKKLPFYQHHPP